MSHRIRFHMARVVWDCARTLRDEPVANPAWVSECTRRVDCHRRSKVLREDFSGFSERVEDSMLLSVVDRRDKSVDGSAILEYKLCRRRARMIQSQEVLREQNCKLDKSAPHQLHLIDDIDAIQLRTLSRRNQMLIGSVERKRTNLRNAEFQIPLFRRETIKKFVSNGLNWWVCVLL